MLSLPSTGIYLCVEPTDMRKSFDSLAQLAREHLCGDPLSGAWFVFYSKRRDRLKILYWDRDGFALWHKRLEEGPFQFPTTVPGSKGLEISSSGLALILNGIDLTTVRQRKRFAKGKEAWRI